LERIDDVQGRSQWLDARAALPFWLIIAVLGVHGCSRYDSSLLGSDARCGDGQLGFGELCDTAIVAGRAGACPTQCSDVAVADPCARSALSGTRCGLHCAPSRITMRIDGDGCCPEGARAADDRDCGACGDSIVGPGETCDPPESCVTPEQCTSSRACVDAVYLGSATTCDARCELRVDDACEDGGNACGDGIVSADAGETCDPGSEGTPCPERCDDDDPCTISTLTGSAATCTAHCSHAPIERFVNGDGCCPAGARAADDSDCGGACAAADAGDECRASPAATTPISCLDPQVQAGRLAPACADCACQRCAASIEGCFFSGDATRDTTCAAAALCIDRTRCRGDECFCGTGSSCAVPAGPCRSELTTAAGSADLETIGRCASDPSCALYWSAQYIECTLRECTAACARP
jgi:hypothetical protein